jgi:hypothetical protein
MKPNESKQTDGPKPIRVRDVLILCLGVAVLAGFGYLAGIGWWPGVAAGIAGVAERLWVRFRFRRVTPHAGQG